MKKKFRVIKDMYYMYDVDNRGEFLTEEELFNSFSHFLVKGDIWEQLIDKPYREKDNVFQCIKGHKMFDPNPESNITWENEINSGLWDFNWVLENGYIEMIN